MSEEKLTKEIANDVTHADMGEDSPNRLISVGDQLRSARESRLLSVDEVAFALKLSPRQVVALEADEWSRLPKTIIRGFVRNYARYLELEAAPLMAKLDNMPLPQGPELEVGAGAPVNMPKEGRTDRRDYVRVIAGLIILLLAVMAYFLVSPDTWRSTLESIKVFVATNRTDAPAAVVAPAENPDNEPGVAVVPQAPAVLLDVPASSSSTTAPVIPASASSSHEFVEPIAMPVAPSSSSDSLDFSFSQPSWVEVRDRSGQIVFSQLSQAGSRREVSGQPPFSLVIGNASNVSLRYKGKPVDLSKRSKDDVARLTLE